MRVCLCEWYGMHIVCHVIHVILIKQKQTQCCTMFHMSHAVPQLGWIGSPQVASLLFSLFGSYVTSKMAAV